VQPVVNVLLAAFFEYGIAIYDVELEKVPTGELPVKDAATHLLRVGRKVGKQVLKDYVAQPLLSGPSFLPALAGTFTANVARNVWTHTVIFCGHFPDGAEIFVEEQLEGETRGEWYVRQLLGSANIDGGPLMHLMTGNLSYQIEHHLFPDLPSNRYAEIAVRVRELCDKYDLPYTTGPLHRQYGQVLRTIMKLSLPNHMTKSDNPAPPERPDTADEGERDRRRKSDAERQPRRTELGGWSRGGKRREHD
jgi:linoleoyl-CoA desaturase